MQLKAIDVAIGMSFLYLLLTFVASAVVELVSNVRNWRAQMLHAAIAKMLCRTVAVDVTRFYNHPLVVSLATNRAEHSWMDLLERSGWRPSSHSGTPPAYVPAAIFSTVVMEFIRRASRDQSDLSPDEEVKTVVRWLQNASTGQCGCRPGALHSVVENAIATQGHSVQAVKLAIEKWFNDTMERTTGWYKRRTRSSLLLIGLLLSLIGNIDSIAVAKWLWEGDAARQAVVTAAADYVKSHPGPAADGASTPKDGKSNTTLLASAKQVAEVDREVAKLDYPIGLDRLVSQIQSKDAGIFWCMQYLFGCLISAIAISMGSPFWFDAMQNLLKLRGTGPKPGAR